MSKFNFICEAAVISFSNSHTITQTFLYVLAHKGSGLRLCYPHLGFLELAITINIFSSTFTYNSQSLIRRCSQRYLKVLTDLTDK